MHFNNATVQGFSEGIAVPIVIYLGLITLQLLHMLVSPGGVSIGRRLFSIAIDQGLLTAAAFVLGPEGTGLYPFYYWIILAAGFRYGTPYLAVAALMSVISLSSLFDKFDSFG